MDENDLVPLLDLTIPQVLLQHDLKFMTDQELEIHLAPIREALGNVDAEKFLRLTRADGKGASIGNGIYVETIHKEIVPSTDGVRYIHVKEILGQYSIGVFVFPPRSIIPLHNHPGMTVLSRILYGSIQVKSFDVICSGADKQERRCSQGNSKTGHHPNDTVKCPKSGLISRILSSVSRSMSRESLSSSGSSTHDTVPLNGLYTYENDAKMLYAPQVTELYPRRGNLHEFTAGPEGAAILDVLIPPYDFYEDRDCTFYEKVESLDLQQDTRCPKVNKMKCWLVPVEQPEWFRCSSGRYKDLGNKDEMI